MLPAESDLKKAESDTLAAGKINRAKPTRDAINSEFGGKSDCAVTRNEHGHITRIEDRSPDKRYLKRLYGMTREAKRLEMDLGQEIQSRKTFIPMKQADGSLDYLHEGHAEKTAKRRGLRPVIKWGTPRERTVARSDGVHLVYTSTPGNPLTISRAYRLMDNGNNTTREVDIPLAEI